MNENMQAWACLVSQLKLTFSHFKQLYTLFKTLFSPTRISKTSKQHYSNYNTKQAKLLNAENISYFH